MVRASNVLLNRYWVYPAHAGCALLVVYIHNKECEMLRNIILRIYCWYANQKENK